MNGGSRWKKSRRARGTTALIEVSPFSAECFKFTYFYVNTSKLDNAANPLPQPDAARVCTFSKSSDDQDRGHKYVVRVLLRAWRTKYPPFALSLVGHEEAHEGEEVVSTEAAYDAANG